jgi:hypothetical protein
MEQKTLFFVQLMFKNSISRKCVNMSPPSVLKDLGADTLTFGGFGGWGNLLCTLTDRKLE